MHITEKTLARAFFIGFVYAQELDDDEVRVSMQEVAEKLLSGLPGPAIVAALKQGLSEKDLAWLRKARELTDIQNRLRKLTSPGATPH